MSAYQLAPNTIRQESTGRWRLSHPAASPGGGLLAITADWCGHCRRLKEQVNRAQMVTPFDVFYLDGEASQEHRNKSTQMGIDGYPSVYYINKDGYLESYQGPRSADALGRKFHRGQNAYGGGSPQSIFSWLR